MKVAVTALVIAMFSAGIVLGRYARDVLSITTPDVIRIVDREPAAVWVICLDENGRTLRPVYTKPEILKPLK